ncbi:MAG: lysoplasmalogenase [Bacteroidetes bacterium]|nr:lysoplasmalogenase [Bacteroidota bacterium]
MTLFVFYSVIVITGFLTIYGKYKKPSIVFFFKPLTTILIIILSFSLSSANYFYNNLIIAGLFCSLAGDIFLLFPEKLFNAGLGAFLLTHLFYSIAFYNVSDRIYILPILFIVIYAYVFYNKLKLRKSKYKLPVIIYISAISLMCFFAVNLFIYNSFIYAGNILVASLLFLVSDSMLAYNKFVERIKPAEIVILSTYYASQVIIASSVM